MFSGGIEVELLINMYIKNHIYAIYVLLQKKSNWNLK